jgi:dCTP deaminase
MSIKSDKWIRRMAQEHGMIFPFESGQVRQSEHGKVISYGTSSYGYDVRCADEFKVFTNINSVIVDPKNFDTSSFVDIKSDVCIIPPNSFALARTVEYFKIPRDVLTVCLGKSTYARCFRGDTKVALVDGTTPTLEEMARRADNGEHFWGYSLGQFGRVIVSLLEAPRFIGRDSLLEITLDDGAVIHCTPDHEFILRDGRMVQADSLRPQDSLMPLYRDVARGYEMVYQPINNHVYPTHRLADEWNIRNGVYADMSDSHRHHIDFNRLNNNPCNIIRMNASEHIRLHNSHNYNEEFDPNEHSLAIKDAFTRLKQDPRWQENFSQAQKQRAVDFWNNQEYAENRAALNLKQIASWQNDERRATASERLKNYYQNEQNRLQASVQSKEIWAQDDGSRRLKQQEVARSLRLREEITPEIVTQALHQTGSIRAAARLLNCDRSVFRRFPETIAAFRGVASPSQAVRNHKVQSIKALAGDHDVYCLTVPEAGNFALDAGVFVSNCGIIVNVTPLEPEWEGHVTLEFSNTTPLPAKIYANEGVAQMLFFGGDEVCETSYRDRGGKYQGQQGVTLPKA